MATTNLSRSIEVGRLFVLLACWATAVLAFSTLAMSQTDSRQANCIKDAMIVLDASGSMTSMGIGERTERRIEQVRGALAKVLPDIAPMRHLGLIVFGPGSKRACENVDLRLRPGPNSASRIMSEVDGLHPYGQTPLTGAVGAAADALEFRDRPAVIVLLTDGEETCRGQPCALANELKSQGRDVTVHVIGYMLRFANQPSGRQFARCLSENTGGMFVSTESTEELVEALRKTLGCPMMSALRNPGLSLNR
ncbi:MAG: VWA domain-containing protein [Methyloceanibacter sp.]|nr:VWA domain-containing protein [Methyloceanibacter sp.]